MCLEKGILCSHCSVARWSATGTGNCHSSVAGGSAGSSGGQRPKRARLMSAVSLGQIERSFATDQLRAKLPTGPSPSPEHQPICCRSEKWQLEARAIPSSGHLNWNCSPFVAESTSRCLFQLFRLAVSSTKHLSLDQWNRHYRQRLLHCWLFSKLVIGINVT